MKKEKNKIKILPLILGAVAIGMFAPKVSAAGLDAASCKDGKVYTHYYYLAEGLDYANVTTSGSISAYIQQKAINEPEYMGYFYNTPQLVSGMTATELAKHTNPNYLFDMGSIQVIADNSFTRNLETITVSQFWNRFLEANGASNYKSDEYTLHMITHSYSAIKGNTIPPTANDTTIYFLGATVDKLSQASILINRPIISANIHSNATTTKLTVGRSYDNATDYLGNSSFVGTQKISGQLSNSTNISNWLVQPALYYIQYCERATTNNTVTLYYDGNVTDNSVQNLPLQNTVNINTQTQIAATEPTRKGYTFQGWSSVPGATTADNNYAPGKTITLSQNMTLYAVWKQGYSVTYDANGGQDAPATQTTDGTSCIKITSSVPKYSKHEFLGWSNAKNPTKTDVTFKAGDEYCGDKGDITLYAVWNPKTGVNEYLIAFGIVAITATGILILTNKKRLFKQI